MAGFEIRLMHKSSWLKDAGYSIEQEADVYDNMLEDLYKNPRWYLENYYYLCEFRVRWANYRGKNPVLPYKYTSKPKAL